MKKYKVIDTTSGEEVYSGSSGACTEYVIANGPSFDIVEDTSSKVKRILLALYVVLILIEITLIFTI